MGARNRVGIGLLYLPARLHRLAESIPWNRFLYPLKVFKKTKVRIFKLVRSTRIDSKEPIARLCSRAGRYNPIPPRFLASIDCLKIPALL
jgi:hypothetical protein